LTAKQRRVDERTALDRSDFFGDETRRRGRRCFGKSGEDRLVEIRVVGKRRAESKLETRAAAVRVLGRQRGRHRVLHLVVDGVVQTCRVGGRAREALVGIDQPTDGRAEAAELQQVGVHQRARAVARELIAAGEHRGLRARRDQYDDGCHGHRPGSQNGDCLFHLPSTPAALFAAWLRTNGTYPSYTTLSGRFLLVNAQSAQNLRNRSPSNYWNETFPQVKGAVRRRRHGK